MSSSNTTLNQCKHQKIIQNKNNCMGNCYHCGALISHSNKTYKSNSMKSFGVHDFQSAYNSLVKKKIKINLVQNFKAGIYLTKRAQLIEMIFTSAKKLNLSLNTIHLTIIYMDYTLSTIYVNKDDFVTVAVTCLLLAAKTNELDKRIPFISKLRKYTFWNIKSEEIKRYECIILANLNWNLVISNNLEIVEFFMSQGIIFSNDCFFVEEKSNAKNQKLNLKQNHLENMSEKEIEKILSNIETNYLSLANLIIKDSHFSANYNDKILAAASICFVRKSCGIYPAWNEELESMTGVISEDLAFLLTEIETKFEKNFNTYCKEISLKNKDELSCNTTSTRTHTNSSDYSDYGDESHKKHDVKQFIPMLNKVNTLQVKNRELNKLKKDKTPIVQKHRKNQLSFAFVPPVKKETFSFIGNFK